MILIECGATVDLTAIFPVRDDLHVFVIDSHRPFSLENIALSPNVKLRARRPAFQRQRRPR